MPYPLGSPAPLLGFIAPSGTGKTTLLERLIPLLKARGLRLAVIKHAHHHFDIDIPGKDSYRLREAGAAQVMVASRHRTALIAESPEALEEPSLPQLLPWLERNRPDLVLVEGFKHERYPRIQLYRASAGEGVMQAMDSDVIAIAADTPCLFAGQEIPILDINQPEAVAEFVCGWLAKQQGDKPSEIDHE